MNSSNETLETISQILSRCTVMGFILLFWWWGALVLGRDFVYEVHSKFAPSMPESQFELINYIGIITTKLVIMLLFLIPCIAIKLTLRKRRAQPANATTAPES